MEKELHAVEFDRITFGMRIDCDTIAYKNFVKSLKREKCISIFGDEFECLTVPYLMLGAIMKEAHWLVTEKKLFLKFVINGLRAGEEIYVKYTDEQIDFRKGNYRIAL